MPDTPSTTLIHFTTPALLKVGETACKQDHRSHQVSSSPGDVTCFACRKSPPFLTRQGGRNSDPLPQRVAPPPLTPPVKLSGIMADSEQMQALAKRAAEHEFKLTDQRNHRNMYSIEETIHHGEYRSTRTVEVYDINPVTVDAVLISSAYCYGSWLDPDGPHSEVRRPKLFELVEDLKHGRTNRVIGWSTFRLV